MHKPAAQTAQGILHSCNSGGRGLHGVAIHGLQNTANNVADLLCHAGCLLAHFLSGKLLWHACFWTLHTCES